jgi:hypothetical protein
MTDVQVPASAVQPTPFEEVAGQFLAYLRASGCSPNIVRAYSHDLRHLAAFLVEQGLDWRALTPARAVDLLIHLRNKRSRRRGPGHHPSLATIERASAPFLAHRAFEDGADTEFAPDLIHIDRLALVGEAGVMGDDEEPADTPACRCNPGGIQHQSIARRLAGTAGLYGCAYGESNFFNQKYSSVSWITFAPGCPA